MTINLTVKKVDSASLHGFSRLKAQSHGESSWVRIYAKDHLGEETADMCIFMPLRLAEMLEDAFHAYEDEISGQETAPISDYTDAIADLPRQQEAARMLK